MAKLYGYDDLTSHILVKLITGSIAIKPMAFLENPAYPAPRQNASECYRPL
jgi:hypothetical protein